jgi:hypothetical protein
MHHDQMEFILGIYPRDLFQACQIKNNIIHCISATTAKKTHDHLN